MKDSSKVLEASVRLKKKKYLQPCLNQRPHFTPFVVSFDGLIGNEAKTVLKVIASKTANKAGNTYSNVTGHVRAHLNIAIVRATHICLRVSIVPTLWMSNSRPQWEDTAGMDLLNF
jgi:hypothetical protein